MRRIPDLAELDPLGVPLPNGTEVTTRVERSFGDKAVTQGSVGRVIAQADGAFDVMVVGVGVVRYARDELRPRKVGQARFAARRAGAWEALRDCSVLETVVGSRAWGLSDASSDVDRRGVFVLPFPWTLGLAEPIRDLVSADGSETFWEAGKAIEQGLRADPNTLEMLFVPGASATDPIGQWILDARDLFVSQEIYGSFGRYALSQLDRLSRANRLAHHQNTVFDHIKGATIPVLDDVARHLARASGDDPAHPDAMTRARDFIKQIYGSLFDRGLIPSRDFPALAAYVLAGGALVEEPRSLRPKNAYNLLRLLVTATGWLREGTPDFEMTGALRDRLLVIKRGEVALEDVLAEAEAMAPALDEARKSTRLPRQPDVRRADALLRRIGEESARRWFQAGPGPLGVDAPSPPDVHWEALT